MRYGARALLTLFSMLVLFQGPSYALDDEFSADLRGNGVKPSTAHNVPVGEFQSAWNETCRRQHELYSAGPGVLRWPFDRNTTLCVHVRRNMTTEIVLPEFERIEYFHLSETSSFQASVQGCGPNESCPDEFRNIIKIWPTKGVVGADAILHVTGRLKDGVRRYYAFYIRSFGIEEKALPDARVYVDALDAPVEQPPAPSQPTAFDAVERALKDKRDKPEWLREVPFDVNKLKFGEMSDYRICAQDEESLSIAPARVFNDDVFVYIDYGERSDAILRASVRRVVDRVGNPVNFRIGGPRDNLLIVEQTGYDLSLINGERVICILYRKECGEE